MSTVGCSVNDPNRTSISTTAPRWVGLGGLEPPTSSLSVLGTHEVPRCEPDFSGSYSASGKPRGWLRCCRSCCQRAGVLTCVRLRYRDWALPAELWPGPGRHLDHMSHITCRICV